MKTTQLRIALAGVLLIGLLGARGARGQATRSIAHVDDTGMWIETQATRVDLATPPAGARGGMPPGVIWHLVDSVSITNRVAVSDTSDEIWVGHNLNQERMSYLQTTGTGTPIYEYQLHDPGFVAVASAENVSLGVLMFSDESGIHARGFTAAGGTVPIWNYDFTAEYDGSHYRNLDVSTDGSVVMLAARNSAAGTTLVVVLDGVTGELSNSLAVNTAVMGLELSDDGARAVLTEGNTAHIINTLDMSTAFSFAVSGGGGYHRISRDGKVVAGGGFNYKVYKEVEFEWELILSGSQSSQWFGYGLGLDERGETLFLVHYNYATGYVHLTYRVFDLTTGIQIAETSTQGAQGLQDTIQIAHASANGCVFAVASWGTVDNAHPEVQVFDRDLNLIGSVDTPGSPFDIDLSRDGNLLAVGGKHVHANISGNGSDTYAYFVGAPYGLGGAGLADHAALANCMGGVGVDVPSECRCTDLDGDGDVDLTDFSLFQLAFAGL